MQKKNGVKIKQGTYFFFLFWWPEEWPDNADFRHLRLLSTGQDSFLYD